MKGAAISRTSKLQSFPTIPILLCAAALAALSGVSAYFLLGSAKHIVLLLALEYLLVLPATLYAFRASRGDRGVLPVLPIGILLVGFFAVTLPFSWIDHRAMLIPDEVAYEFQARIFSRGQLFADAPPGSPAHVENTPLPLYFEHTIIDGGHWFTKYPPGWPLVLALALRLGAGWILNPALGFTILLILAVIARRLFDDATARLALLLAVLSPFFLANCMGRMAHPASTLLLAVACLCCFQGLRTLHVAPFAWMALLIVLASEVRPFTAAVVGGTLAVGALWYLRRERIFSRVAAVGALVASLGLASLLVYNRIYTGSYRVSPYSLFNQNPLTRSGNFSDIDLNPWHMIYHLGHSTRWAVQDTVYYAFPFVFLLAGYAVWREKERPREVRILGCLFPVLVLAHVIQPSVDVEFGGERYYFEAYFAVLILGARGVALLAERVSSSKRVVAALLMLFAAFELGQLGLAAHDFLARTLPYREVRAAAGRLGDRRVTVFLHDSPAQFVAKHFNLNRPDWLNGSQFFLVDPGPSGRSEWACRMGRPDWVVLSYDPTQFRATEEFGHAGACP